MKSRTSTRARQKPQTGRLLRRDRARGPVAYVRSDPGGWLRSFRARFALTQGDLGRLLGVHQVTVARWEAGRLRLSAFQREVLGAVGRGSDCDAGDFLRRYGPVNALGFLLRNCWQAAVILKEREP